MNLVEELKSLDVNDVGRWPLVFRTAVIGIVFVFVAGAGIYLTIVKDKAPQLQRAQDDEQTLRVTFENKQRKAANYDAYKDQLAEIEQSFGTMLRQLPGETEIPSLIVDVSQTGLASGLQEKLFQPQPEIPRDFYAEKPIKIRLWLKQLLLQSRRQSRLRNVHDQARNLGLTRQLPEHGAE